MKKFHDFMDYPEQTIAKEVEEKELELTNHPPKVRFIDGVAMTCIGMINNLFFLIIMSSAQRIVDEFQASGMLAVVNWSCTFCGIFSNALNSLLSSYNISYDARFIANTTCMLIGLIGCALSFNFWLSCFSILFVGFSCNFGESVSLGYLAYVNKQHYVKFWGIGTGIAGICGSLYSAVCVYFEVPYKISFYCLIPFVPIYFCCYFFSLRTKPVSKIEQPLLTQSGQPSQTTKEEGVKEKENHIKKICNAKFLKNMLYYIITCDIVYFAQYVIASAFLDCAQKKEDYEDTKYLFPLLTLVQHIGVLIFCSTLNWFQCIYLEVMAGVQVLNFLIWMTQAMLHWMPIWAEFIFIFLVGSCGGLSYVNTYHMIMIDDKLDHKEKELGTNITAFSVTLSVLISSGFSLLSEKTYLKPFVPNS